MKKSPLPCLLTLLAIGVTHALAADSSATVTAAVNQVTHGPAQSTTAYPAKVGTQLSDGEYLKTGASSRAEMELANKTITRLGSNTIFNYSAATNTVDLQAGTFLFSKPKDSKPMTIKTAAVTAAIVGTTGFVHQTSGGGFLIGLVEGHSTAVINGITYNITAGEILQYTPGSPPQIFAFDIPKFYHTSGFFKNYHDPLPNQSYIDQEIADYNDLVGRGFIQPPTDPFYIYDTTGNIPVPPVVGTDSAGTALGNANTPPPPPPKCCRWED